MLQRKRTLVVLMLVALILALAAPVVSFGQGRGRRGGRGRDFDNWKCGRFVNCHDARDGRRDGRGPRRNAVSDWDWRNHRNNRWDDRRWNDRRNAGSWDRDRRWWGDSDRRQNRRDSDRRWNNRSEPRTDWVRSTRWRR